MVTTTGAAAAWRTCSVSLLALLVLAVCITTCASNTPIEAAVAATEDDAAISCLQRQVAGVEKAKPETRAEFGSTRNVHSAFTEQRQKPVQKVAVTGKSIKEHSGRSPRQLASQDPYFEDYYDAEFGSGSCGPPGKSGFFASLVRNDDDPDFVAIDLTEAFKRDETVTVLITAMSTKGSYTDEYGFDVTRAFPLEDTENTLLEFRLSANKRHVEVYKPAMSQRTSDNQTKLALKDGLGDGFLDSHSILECSKKEDPDGSRIVINAEPLFYSGFYVASSLGDGLYYQIKHTASFPNNFDISAQYIMGADYPSMYVGFSVITLPKTPMPSRASDDRLLYFSSDYRDLGYRQSMRASPPSHEVDRFLSTIWRYNLASLKDGTIRIYVDPSVPSRWRGWFREGVEAWNDAFSAIGFPHAVRAVLPGEDDWPPDYDIADARFSTISWDLSDEVASMGIAKVDPRSGEIIKSDIIMADGWAKAWLQDLEELVPDFTLWSSKDASMLQQNSRRSLASIALLSSSSVQSRRQSGLRVERGSHSAKGVRMKPDHQMNASAQEALLGAGLRSIVMHETGHILGLRHNFKGSLGVTSSCLQDMACTGKNGIGASVMDYVPMNIPQTGELDDVHVFSPVIGAYDKLAIAYGYIVEHEPAPWPAMSMELQSMLDNASFETCYDEDADSGEDPTCIPYDLTDDPVAYFEQELDRYALAHRHLLENSVAPGEPYRFYGRAFSDLMDKTSMISDSVVGYIGGIRNHYVHRAKDGSLRSKQMSRQPIAVDTQRRALALLLRTLRPRVSGLAAPVEHLQFLVEGSRQGDSVSSVDHQQKLQKMTHSILDDMLSTDKLLRVYKQETMVSSSNTATLTVRELLNSLIGGILEPGLEQSSENVSADEMDLQMYLITKLKDLYMYSAEAQTESSGDEDFFEDDFFGFSDTETQDLPAVVNSHVLHSLRQALLLTRQAYARLPRKSPYKPMWQQCAREGERCACEGLVRRGSARQSQGQQDTVFSSVRAIPDSIICSATEFLAGPSSMGSAEPMMLLQTLHQRRDRYQVNAEDSWCECLASEMPEGSEMMQTHLALLGRELSHVFCDDALNCQSPRVPALLAEGVLPERSAAVRRVSALALTLTMCLLSSVSSFQM